MVSGSAAAKRPIRVLLVEDDPADVVLFERMLEQSQFSSDLHVVHDGIEALEFLRRENGFADAPDPDLVLLDLNMPRKTGVEVLHEMKSDAALQEIPVVIVSTAAEDPATLQEIRTADCCIAKPVTTENFRWLTGFAARD